MFVSLPSPKNFSFRYMQFESNAFLEVEPRVTGIYLFSKHQREERTASQNFRSFPII